MGYVSVAAFAVGAFTAIVMYSKHHGVIPPMVP